MYGGFLCGHDYMGKHKGVDQALNEFVDHHGLQIFKTYRDCGWDLDYILQEWLPNEIINYLIVLVRHEDHQFDEAIGKKGIPRGDVFSLDEKLSGKHYEHAGIPLPLLVTDERARIIR